MISFFEAPSSVFHPSLIQRLNFSPLPNCVSVFLVYFVFVFSQRTPELPETRNVENVRSNDQELLLDHIVDRFWLLRSDRFCLAFAILFI